MSPYYPPLGGGGSSNSGGLMGTANFLVTWSSDPLISNEKILTAGENVTITTAANTITIAATTGGGSGTAQPTIPGNIPMGSVIFKQVNTQDLVIGNSSTYDLYTVPVGKRAALLTSNVFNNSTTGSAVARYFIMVKTNGLYYPFHGSSTSNPSVGSTVEDLSFIADAGETLAIYLSGNGSTMSVNLKVVEIDTSVNVRTIRLYGLTSGNNTLFTSVNSSTAVGLGDNLIFDAGNTALFNVNGGSGSVVWRSFLVPSGQTVDSKYQIMSTAAVASVARSIASCAITMTSGSYLSVFYGSTVASSLVWANIMES